MQEEAGEGGALKQEKEEWHKTIEGKTEKKNTPRGQKKQRCSISNSSSKTRTPVERGAATQADTRRS